MIRLFRNIDLATGYLSKKLFIGKSDNMARKLAGGYLQLIITNLIAQHPEKIISIGQVIFQHITRKRNTFQKQ